MVSISLRMRKLTTRLLAMRVGSGALLLPKEVTKIHMRFAPKIDGGHMGPRKFWRQELVRLKYHNPAVVMTVDNTALKDDPATMTIHFAESDPSQANATTTSAGTSDGSAPTARVSTIDMKHRMNSEILEELVKATKAKEVPPTEQDREEMRSLADLKARSEADSKLSQEVRNRLKREKELLDQARGEMA